MALEKALLAICIIINHARVRCQVKHRISCVIGQIVNPRHYIFIKTERPLQREGIGRHP
jgi:hypothetical protein